MGPRAQSCCLTTPWMAPKKATAKKKAALSRGYATTSILKAIAAPEICDDEDVVEDQAADTPIVPPEPAAAEQAQDSASRFETRERTSDLFRDLISSLPRSRKRCTPLSTGGSNWLSKVTGLTTELAKVFVDEEVEHVLANLTKQRRTRDTTNKDGFISTKRPCWSDYTPLGRVTIRRLNALYSELSGAGFSHAQISTAMKATLGMICPLCPPIIA